MDIASFSLKRVIFISSIVLLIMSVGYLSLNKLGVDMFPNVEMPFIVVTTIYPGASTEEIESLISKPMEEEISSISGLKKLTSINQESFSVIWAQFTLETDVKYAEQQMRDKVARIRSKLPEDIKEPLFQRYDPSSQAILRFALQADLSATDLYDVAREVVKPKIEQIKNVGVVNIIGGTRREIQVELDRKKLNEYNIPALLVADALKGGGANIPIGKHDQGPTFTVFRSIGQFETLKQIENSLIFFAGDVNNSITLKSLATVRDSTEDPRSLAFLYYPKRDKHKKIIGDRDTKPALFLEVYKQSGTNTVAVAEEVMKSMDTVNDYLKTQKGAPKLVSLFNAAKPIKSNIDEVKFTIILGIILAVIVVYFFLGNIRSTIITGIAIPNSLLGSFIFMYIMGFSINFMTLMALSLTVGLLIDDAIVVRENIFRKLELNMRSFKAAIIGTREVMLAVIATTMTIIAVFFPIGFLQGMVGKFFKEFGFTVVFAMIISLFDALTVAPFLSGYFAGKPGKAKNILVKKFDEFQDALEGYYSKAMDYALTNPVKIILAALAVFIVSLWTATAIKQTFMPESNDGQFLVRIEMPPGTSLAGTRETVGKIEDKLKESIPQIEYLSASIGNELGETNIAEMGIYLVPAREREGDTNTMKTRVRALLKEFSYAKPKVCDLVLIGWDYPFVLTIKGNDLDQLEEYSQQVLKSIQKVPELIEAFSSSQGRMPEFHVSMDSLKMQSLGVQPKIAGAELRYHIAGDVVGKLHQNELEYDIRMRLRPEQRDLKSAFAETKIPNQHWRLIPLSQIASGKKTHGSSRLMRENRSRIVQISANLVPGGAIESAKSMVEKILKSEAPPPKGITYEYEGQAEDYKDLSENMTLALILSIIFIYFVLASLYESFITPITILLALPPALSGAFFGLYLTGDMLNIFSMIGIVMLMGLVTKNSILLVDFALEGVRTGMTRKEAIHKAGMIRLRPILMTTFAMIAGTLPLALGIGEAAQFRSAMGSAIIGGLIISTLITLLVVPAVFEYIDRFREFVESRFRPADLASQMAEVFPDDHSLMAEEFTEGPAAAADTEGDREDGPAATPPQRNKRARAGRP